MKLGKKNAMETGTFMAYACSCNCWCACTCNNCQSIGSANGKQVASNTQTSTTQVKSKGSLLLLAQNMNYFNKVGFTVFSKALLHYLRKEKYI